MPCPITVIGHGITSSRCQTASVIAERTPSVPQVLLLGYRAASFTEAAWPSLPAWQQAQGACPEAIDKDVLPYPTRQARADAVSVAASMQVAAAWAKNRARARKAQVQAGWVWALKRDSWVRSALRDADVVISLDGETDRALAMIPELLSQTSLIQSADAGDCARGITLLADVLERLHEIVDRRQEPARLLRKNLDDDELADMAASGDRAARFAVPGVLLPVLEVAAVLRRLDACVGRVPAATVLHETLAGFRWERAPLVGESGLLAQLGSARLWLAATEAELPDDEGLCAATEAALVGADLAFADNDSELARERLADALGVMFHRERHAESGHSSLVDDPKRFLGSMYANTTFNALLHDGKPRRPRHRPATNDAVRVLLLASASGQFHIPVAQALSRVAEVTVEGPEMAPRFLTKRGMDVQVLEALVWLRHPKRSDEPSDTWGAQRANARVTRALGPTLRGADVVLADWADRITVWASHMVPSGVRFIIRIHSLDALQPWFHLVKWSNVDLVLVQAETIHQIVEQMLSVAGVDVPVKNVPNLIAMDELDQPKLPTARTTLGMIGWGRRVKDPIFALDLLAREPSWRLLLIGHGLHPPTSRSAAAYNADVEARLADPAIAERVEFVGWTDDIPAELRRIGVILSTSRREGWHLGLVEGAASGAVPVVRDWPIWKPLGGARRVYPREWVVDDLDQAEARVRAVTEYTAWEAARRRAQSQAQGLFDPDLASKQYCELVVGVRPPD